MNVTLRGGASSRIGAVLIFLIVGFVALAVRVGAQFALNFYATPEAFEYDVIARNIVAGQGYLYDHNGVPYVAFAEPLFTLFLALAYAAFGVNSVTAGALLLATGVGQCLLVVALGRRIGGPTTSLLAGLATALHPGLVVYATRIHPLAFDGAIVVAAALALHAFADHADIRTGALNGLVAGVAGLERATVVPIMAVAIAMLVWQSHRRAQMLRSATVLAIVACVVVVPWIARNDILLGEPTLTSSGSEVLWYGNNPKASGGALTEDGIPMLEASPEMRDAVWGKPEIEQQRIFQQAAVAYMAQDPWRTVRADAAKLAAFWWFTPRSGLLYPRGWLLPYQLYYVALLVGAFVGVAQLIRLHPRSLFIVGTLCVGVSVVQSAFYVEGRHRWEIEPLLLAVAAVGVLRLGSSISARGRRTRPDGRVVRIPGS